MGLLFIAFIATLRLVDMPLLIAHSRARLLAVESAMRSGEWDRELLNKVCWGKESLHYTFPSQTLLLSVSVGCSVGFNNQILLEFLPSF